MEQWILDAGRSDKRGQRKTYGHNLARASGQAYKTFLVGDKTEIKYLL